MGLCGILCSRTENFYGKIRSDVFQNTVHKVMDKWLPSHTPERLKIDPKDSERFGANSLQFVAFKHLRAKYDNQIATLGVSVPLCETAHDEFTERCNMNLLSVIEKDPYTSLPIVYFTLYYKSCGLKYLFQSQHDRFDLDKYLGYVKLEIEFFLYVKKAHAYFQDKAGLLCDHGVKVLEKHTGLELGEIVRNVIDITDRMCVSGDLLDVYLWPFLCEGVRGLSQTNANIFLHDSMITRTSETADRLRVCEKDDEYFDNAEEFLLCESERIHEKRSTYKYKEE